MPVPLPNARQGLKHQGARWSDPAPKEPSTLRRAPDQRVAGFTKSADQIEKWWKELNDAE